MIAIRFRPKRKGLKNKVQRIYTWVVEVNCEFRCTCLEYSFEIRRRGECKECLKVVDSLAGRQYFNCKAPWYSGVTDPGHDPSGRGPSILGLILA